MTVVCYRNSKHITDASNPIAFPSTCDHYSRSAPNFFRTKPIDEMWLQLSNAVALGLIRLDFQVPTDTQGVKNVSLVCFKFFFCIVTQLIFIHHHPPQGYIICR